MEENNKNENTAKDNNIKENTGNTKEKKKWSLKQKIILTIAIVVVLIGLAWIIYFIVDYLRGQNEYKDLNQNYTVSNGTEWYNMIDVDIAELKQKNPDTRGWIFFENDDISYPIVQGTDDDKYLNTSFEGEQLRAGSIFLEALNHGDFSDKNNIIYGHNMRDQSMFGKLQKYKFEDNYYGDHKYFQILTPDRIYRFMVFAYNDVSDTSDVYTLTFATDKEFVDYITMVKQLSQIQEAVPDVAEQNATDSEKILQNYRKLVTLSTCTSQDDMRFVVLGDLVGEYDRVNKELIYDSIENQKQQ